MSGPADQGFSRHRRDQIGRKALSRQSVRWIGPRALTEALPVITVTLCFQSIKILHRIRVLIVVVLFYAGWDWCQNEKRSSSMASLEKVRDEKIGRRKFVRVKDNTGNEYVCLADHLLDPEKLTEEEMAECFDSKPQESPGA